ncbi:RNA-guided endonuclease TnpB family protein [Natronoarchaeum sp. GCM10025703]|uniref:RNA-guided endonuclease TnpB family protein n=1 Tax=unclassified Natronoarchaeum TaxID=2620183 RepID=UPI003611A209
MKELVETLCFRLHIESGERWRLKQARFDARPIANHTWAMRQLGYSKTEIAKQVTPTANDFVKNNAQAVVWKACDAYNSYESALKKWHNSDNQDDLPKPQPPATDSLGAFPLVMNHGEGYELTVRDKDDRVGYRISTQPYKEKVRGVLRGNKQSLDRVKHALDSSSSLSVGRAEVVYREGVYYLHVPIQQPVELDAADDAESVIAIDINERNITTTVLDRESRETLAQLTIDYGQVKQKRQRYYDIKRRCQEHDKHSVVHEIGNHVENFTEWTLHRLSKVIEHYVRWFPNPVVVFESLDGIRNDMDYGSYMNRRLHKLPFHEFERQVTYKAHRHGAPVEHVESEYNSQRCACCGELGSRNGGRFTCQNDVCALEQDHSDRNASVNAAVRWIAKTETGDDSHSNADNYRPRKTPPQVRVRRVGSGRHNTTNCGGVDVNRPTSSHEIASQGVLHS